MNNPSTIAQNNGVPMPTTTSTELLEVQTDEPNDWLASSEVPAPLDPKRLRRNPLMSRLSWALVAGLIAVGGFAVGSKVKGDSKPAGIAGLPAGFPALGGGGGGLPSLPAGFDLSTLLGGGSKSSAVLPASTTSAGEIVLVSGGKIYVKMPDGTTKAVAMNSGTSISKATPADSSSLTVGQRVLVDGRTGDNGVVAANAIVVQPDTAK
jgi:hypothetical protein